MRTKPKMRTSKSCSLCAYGDTGCVIASISANTDVDIPSAAPSDSVAIATNPGARLSDLLVCGIAAAVARRKANAPLIRSVNALMAVSVGVYRCADTVHPPDLGVKVVPWHIYSTRDTFRSVAGVIQLVECQLPKHDLQGEATSKSIAGPDLRDERKDETPDQVQTECTSQVQTGPDDPLEVEPVRRGTRFAAASSANLPIRRAAQRLARAPNDASAIAQLVQSVITALSKSPGPRRPGRSNQHLEARRRLAQHLRVRTQRLASR